MTLEDAIQHIGGDITIYPHVGIGESRDTEAGLQPWKAVLVGLNITVDGARPVVQQDGYPPHELRDLDGVFPR